MHSFTKLVTVMLILVNLACATSYASEDADKELKSTIVELTGYQFESSEHQDIVVETACTIISACRADGWNDKAIAGLLGNLQAEGNFRAFAYESDWATSDGCWNLTDAFLAGNERFVFADQKKIASTSGGCGLVGWTASRHRSFSEFCEQKMNEGAKGIIVSAPWRESETSRSSRTYDGTYMCDTDIQMVYILTEGVWMPGVKWGFSEPDPHVSSVQEYRHYEYTSASQAAATWLYYYEQPAKMGSEAKKRARYAEKWLSQVLSEDYNVLKNANEDHLRSINKQLCKAEYWEYAQIPTTESSTACIGAFTAAVIE